MPRYEPDFFIDRGQGPSFDAPYEVIDCGPDAARKHLDAATASCAVDMAEQYGGEIVVYVPCPRTGEAA